MKVIINGKVYDPNDELIIVHLNDKDKKNIAGMDESATLYASFPDGTLLSEVDETLEHWKGEFS